MKSVDQVVTYQGGTRTRHDKLIREWAFVRVAFDHQDAVHEPRQVRGERSIEARLALVCQPLVTSACRRRE